MAAGQMVAEVGGGEAKAGGLNFHGRGNSESAERDMGTPALCSSNCLSRRQWKMQREARGPARKGYGSERRGARRAACGGRRVAGGGRLAHAAITGCGKAHGQNACATGSGG
jgi:hypothetical protein